MTCGVVSDFGPMLVCGFTTSELRAWSLTGRKLQPPVPCLGSRVRLAVDGYESDGPKFHEYYHSDSDILGTDSDQTHK